MIHTLRRASLGASGLALITFLGTWLLGHNGLACVFALATVLTLAFGLKSVSSLKGYQFTVWILAAVLAGMLYPSAFQRWGDFDLRNKWLILVVVQLVMFGMGTQMSLHDFRGVVKTPRGVLVGILCHFTIMPLVGFSLTKLFHFPDEIAAGIILIGSCSSGLASNVMAYLAGANLVLSVTVTAVTTLLAPFLTPLLMKLLAGTLVEVKFTNMMMEIIKIVLIPIGAALLHDYLKHAGRPAQRRVSLCSVVAVLWLGFLTLGGWAKLTGSLSETQQSLLSLPGFVLGACLAGQVYHQATRLLPRLDAWMPVASMFGIVYFTTVTTAAGRDNLLKVGLLLFLASAMHNAAGYFFGYWLSRGAGLDKSSARSVAFEVGLQNGGMASGIAGSLGKLSTLGLASAIFSPWMNISGSILANFWRKRPVEPSPEVQAETLATEDSGCKADLAQHSS